MKRTRIFFILTLLVAGAVVEAQQIPTGKWWRREEVVRQLALTSDQQTRLDEVFRAAADELIDSKAAIEKLQVALRGELDRPQLRRQELQRLAAQLSGARARLFERELMMLADMRGILDQEQWTKLRTFLDRVQDRVQKRQEAKPQQRVLPRRRVQ